jgi:NCAIR mutase (PurE)-related protein
VHVSAARIRETEERVRAQEQEAARKAMMQAVTEATVRMQLEHQKATASAELEVSVRREKEKEQAVEAAVAQTRDEMTQTLGAKFEARLNQLLAGIAESDITHEARRAALQQQLNQANEALELTLDRLTAHKPAKR